MADEPSLKVTDTLSYRLQDLQFPYHHVFSQPGIHLSDIITKSPSTGYYDVELEGVTKQGQRNFKLTTWEGLPEMSLEDEDTRGLICVLSAMAGALFKREVHKVVLVVTKIPKPGTGATRLLGRGSTSQALLPHSTTSPRAREEGNSIPTALRLQERDREVPNRLSQSQEDEAFFTRMDRLPIRKKPSEQSDSFSDLGLRISDRIELIARPERRRADIDRVLCGGGFTPRYRLLNPTTKKALTTAQALKVCTNLHPSRIIQYEGLKCGAETLAQPRTSSKKDILQSLAGPFAKTGERDLDRSDCLNKPAFRYQATIHLVTHKSRTPSALKLARADVLMAGPYRSTIKDCILEFYNIVKVRYKLACMDKIYARERSWLLDCTSDTKDEFNDQSKYSYDVVGPVDLGNCHFDPGKVSADIRKRRTKKRILEMGLEWSAVTVEYVGKQ